MIRKFTFLLCTLLAASSLLAADPLPLWISGYTIGDFKLITTNIPVSPNSSRASTSFGPATFTVTPPVGTKLSYWMLEYDEAPVRHDWSENDLYSTENPLTVGYVPDHANAYIVSRLDYIEYELRFDTLGGSNPPTNVSVRVNYTNELRFAAYSGERRGYQFGGWTNNLNAAAAPLTGDLLLNGAKLGVTNDNEHVVLAAKWIANAYRLHYELDGGEFGSLHPETASYGTSFKVSDPHRTGYSFKEWTIESPSADSSKRATHAGGETECLNLTDLNDVTVTLTAVWVPETYQVKFNNKGASSGPDKLVVTFGAKPDAVNVPVKDGNDFLGFYADEDWSMRLWDGEGQPTVTAWNIPSNTTVYAKWDASTIWIEYDPNGGQGEIASQGVPFGASVQLSDGAAFTYAGCVLLGWAENAGASVPQYELSSVHSFKKDVRLFAVWQMQYSVAFNGHGATSGKMEVQPFVRGVEQPLTPNGYRKTGYTFLGWADSEASADVLKVKYEDREVVKDLSNVPGATNTLWAVWGTNTYYVAYAPGAGSGEMPVQEFKYDATLTLPECTFTPPSDLYLFDAWLGTDGVRYADKAVTSNLCAVAQGTNTLTALWKLDVGPWSEAMHCTTARWDVDNVDKSVRWQQFKGSQYGVDESGSCVGQVGWAAFDDDYPAVEWLSLPVTTNGTITLKCKWKSAQFYTTPQLRVGFSLDQEEFCYYNPEEGNASTNADVTATDWVSVTIRVPKMPEVGRTCYVHMLAWGGSEVEEGDGANVLYIDQVTWTPEGGSPEPRYADVDTPVSSFTATGGKLSFSFLSDGGVYHLLGTNDLVAPWPWPFVREIKAGEDRFEIPMDSDQSRMFYRIRAFR